VSEREENEYQDDGGSVAAPDDAGLDVPSEDLGPIDASRLDIRDTLVSLNRVAKVVKGGRRFSFAALVAVGDGNGHVGLGFGKANEVPDAIQKATDRARKNLIQIPLMGRTIPHQVIGIHDSAQVMLKPASEGTGLIAGSAIRLYLSLAGVHDILAKSLGSDNVINVIKATLSGLRSMHRPDEIARLRGKKIESLIGTKRTKIYMDSKAHTASGVRPEGFHSNDSGQQRRGGGGGGDRRRDRGDRDQRGGGEGGRDNSGGAGVTEQTGRN